MAMTGDQIYGRPSLPRMSGGGWGEFVRRRLAEIAGGIFIAIALAYLLSVLTARESDPSFNRAIDGPTLNLMGPVGAFVGDFALQGLGLAAHPVRAGAGGLGLEADPRPAARRAGGSRSRCCRSPRC